MKLVWNSSGDELPIEGNQQLVDYYVNGLNLENKNKFTVKNTDISIESINSFEQAYAKVIQDLEKFNINVFDQSADVFNQQFLNETHTKWVKLGIEHSKILIAFRMMGETHVDNFRAINELIHQIENMFNLSATNFDKDPWQLKNTLGPNILSFDPANISIVFHNLGRQRYNRFRNWDTSWDGHDDFSTFSGELKVNLSRPETRLPSKEYIEWCKSNNEEPIGWFCPLANFKNIDDNLKEYRKIIYNNLFNYDQSNYFFFEI